MVMFSFFLHVTYDALSCLFLISYGWEVLVSDISLVSLMWSMAQYDLSALLVLWCASHKHGLSRSCKSIASLSLGCFLCPWSKDCDVLIMINLLCFSWGSIVEWFYSCVEVYGIVYVEGIVVASVSWVVVRTYISQWWLRPDRWCI